MPEDQWSPDKELDDKEEEKQVVSDARAKARFNYLVEKFSKKDEPKRKRRSWSD